MIVTTIVYIPGLASQGKALPTYHLQQANCRPNSINHLQKYKDNQNPSNWKSGSSQYNNLSKSSHPRFNIQDHAFEPLNPWNKSALYKLVTILELLQTPLWSQSPCPLLPQESPTCCHMLLPTFSSRNLRAIFMDSLTTIANPNATFLKPWRCSMATHSYSSLSTTQESRTCCHLQFLVGTSKPSTWIPWSPSPTPSLLSSNLEGCYELILNPLYNSLVARHAQEAHLTDQWSPACATTLTPSSHADKKINTI